MQPLLRSPEDRPLQKLQNPHRPYEAKFNYLFNPRKTLNETFKGDSPSFQGR